MSDLISIGSSALSTTRRRLLTTGQNIANVNTEGYSRQRVEQGTLTPQRIGDFFQGRGVAVNAVRRVVDDFLIDQVRTHTTNHAKMDALHELSSAMERFFAAENDNLAPALNNFFSSLQDLANDPASIPARQGAISGMQSLADQINQLDRHFEQLNAGVNSQLKQTVEDINSKVERIVALNQEIVQVGFHGDGQAPNDLLDERDQQIGELSKLIQVRTQEQDDGTFNVFVGSGQLLVSGDRAFELGIADSELYADQSEITYDVQGANTEITDLIQGGDLAGIIEFREKLLNPARNDIGRLATTMAVAMNQQHRTGIDLNGDIGGDLFSIPEPAVVPSETNAGTLSVQIDTDNLGDLRASDYQLAYDGSAFELIRLSDGNKQTLSGNGPYSVDGMLINVGNPPADGDSYLIQPVRQAASGLRAVVTDVRKLAAAGPLSSSASLENIGDASISPVEVIDREDSALLATTTITFSDPPESFQVNGSGNFTYTSGEAIDINGRRITINGTPKAGDEFTVQRNSSGVGDNSNILALAGLQDQTLLSNGTATLQQTYSQIVGEVGLQTRQAEISANFAAAALLSAENASDQVSGVNLDEEAANLVRDQQVYQAAAQIVAVAESTFQTLLNAVGR